MASQTAPQIPAGIEDVSRGPMVITVAVVATAIAAFAVGLRLVTRIWIMKHFGPEDWMMIPALALSCAVAVLQVMQVSHGTGRHIYFLNPADGVAAQKLLYWTILCYIPCLGLVKISLVLQYLRIFVEKPVRRVCWALIALIATYHIAADIASVFSCWPIRKFWDPAVPGHCINLNALWYCSASFGILSDLLVFVTPIIPLRRSQLRKRQKIGVICVFAVGSFACITSIFRLHTLYVLSHSQDQTWDNTSATVWSSVESNACIVCACLTTMKPLIMRFAPRLLHSMSRVGTRFDQSQSNSELRSWKQRKTHASAMHRLSDQDLMASRTTNATVTIEKREVGEPDIGFGNFASVTTDSNGVVQAATRSDGDRDGDSMGRTSFDYVVDKSAQR